MMREACEKNIFKSYKAREKKIDISLLQYVDDTIFVSIFVRDMIINNVMVVKSILRWFKFVSKLKFNFHKSRLEVLRWSRKWWRGTQDILNCKRYFKWQRRRRSLDLIDRYSNSYMVNSAYKTLYGSRFDSS